MPRATTRTGTRRRRAGAGSGGGASGGNGAGGVIIDTDGSVGCDPTCSNDLTAVVDCIGQVLETCTADQGCANAKCIDNPCAAAEQTKSSYGCDYWAVKTALRPQADGACFAAFVANTWAKPAHLDVSYNNQVLDPKTFAYIPTIGANGAVQYDPYDPAVGIEVGKVAILFLSRKSQGASVVDCPKPAALTIESGVVDTGKGKAFHITSDYPVVAYQIVPFGGGQAAVTSATLLLPTSAWDTNYIAINAYKASQVFPDAWPSMAIVAKENATKVTLLPNAAIVGGVGVPAAPAEHARRVHAERGRVPPDHPVERAHRQPHRLRQTRRPLRRVEMHERAGDEGRLRLRAAAARPGPRARQRVRGRALQEPPREHGRTHALEARRRRRRHDAHVDADANPRTRPRR